MLAKVNSCVEKVSAAASRGKLSGPSARAKVTRELRKIEEDVDESSETKLGESG